MSNPIYQLLTVNQTIFAATHEGLLVSHNSGQSWQLAYQTLNPPNPIPTFAVLASPRFTENGLLFTGIPGGILRSRDKGETWQVLTLPEPAPAVSALALLSDGVLLVGTAEDGIFRSADQGETWEIWNFGLLDQNINYLTACDSRIYAGTESGIFVSETSGRSWQETSFPMNAAPVLSLTTVADGEMLAGTDAFGLWRSPDNGQTWRPTAVSSGRVEGIWAQNEQWYHIHEGLVMTSGNHGLSWQPITQLGTQATAFTLTQNHELFVGFGNGELVAVDKILIV